MGSKNAVSAGTQQALEILDLVQALPEASKTLPPPTFLEVAGYPHLENVASNLLEFFLDPGNHHGLGSLCLDALFKVLGVTGTSSDATIEREVTTEAGNRIDLVIETDTHLIGIENKIFHDVDNPFADYAKSLKKRAAEANKEVVLVLLALRPAPDGPGHGFKPLSYRRLIDQVRVRLRDAPGSGESNYRILLDDFFDTILNLEGGSIMQPEWTDLFETRRADLEVLLEHTNAFKEKLRDKVKELAKLVDVKKLSNVKQWTWCEPHYLHDVLVYDVTRSDGLLVTVDVVASPKGWSIELWAPNDFQLRKVKAGGLAPLRKRLEVLGIAFEAARSTTDPAGKEPNRCVYEKRFRFDDDPAVVARELKEIIEKLAA